MDPGRAARWRHWERKLREERGAVSGCGGKHRTGQVLLYRQIDSVKQLKRGGLQELQRIEARRYDRRERTRRYLTEAIIWRWCLKPPRRPVSLPMPALVRRKKHSLYAA